jgi:hypothetical protein
MTRQNTGAMERVIRALQASRKEATVEVVQKIIADTGLEPLDPGMLRHELSGFASGREYSRQNEQRPPSDARKRAASIKGHAERLHRLLQQDPKFELWFPDASELLEWREFMSRLEILRDRAETVSNNEQSNGLERFLDRGESAEALIGYSLAIIYEQCFDAKAATSNPSEGGNPRGPFVRFIKSIHRHLYAFSEKPDISSYTIRKALERMRPDVEGWRKATSP